MKTRLPWPLRIVSLALLMLSLSGADSPEVTAQIRPDRIEVETISINLDEKHPERKSFGSLQLLSAIHLRSKDRRFGGLSGISFGTDGRLYAVSDRGYWVSAAVDFDKDGVISSLGDWQIAPMLAPTSQPVSGTLRDAEALTGTADGSFLVGFEGAHRVWRYAAPPATMSHTPAPIDIPPALARAPRNGGIEALTELPDRRLLLLTEDFRRSDGSVRGWLREADRWEELSYMPADGFSVTDCVALAHGDLLVMERRFALIAILSTRVTIVASTAIRPGAKLTGKEILRLEQPLTVENFEGMAIRETEQGTSVFLMSDDNYNPFQQTLLLQFLLPSVNALTTHAAP